MIEKIAARIQDAYTKRRVEVGTATEESASDLFFKPIREKGWLGFRDGWNSFQKKLVEKNKDNSIIEYKAIVDFITLLSLTFGGIQVLLVLAGLNSKERATWDWINKSSKK